MGRLYIGLETDRLTVASILVKNKYTVRQGSQRRSSGKTYDYFLEYERNPVADVPKKGVGTDES